MYKQLKTLDFNLIKAAYYYCYYYYHVLSNHYLRYALSIQHVRR